MSFQETDTQGIEQTYLTSDGNSFPYVSVLSDNSNGFFVRDPAKAFAYPETSDIFTNVVYPLSRVATGIKGIRLFGATPDGSPIDLTATEQNLWQRERDKTKRLLSCGRKTLPLAARLRDHGRHCGADSVPVYWEHTRSKHVLL